MGGWLGEQTGLSGRKSGYEYLYGSPNWNPDRPDLMGKTAPSFRDIQVGAFNFANPGQLDLSQTNPALYEEIQQLKNLRAGAKNYGPEAQQRAYQQALNLAAAQGLAGSSAGMGAATDAYRRTGIDWELNSMDRMANLATQIANMSLIGQNQYSGFQNTAYNAYSGNLGADAADRAQQRQYLMEFIGMAPLVGRAASGWRGGGGGGSPGLLSSYVGSGGVMGTGGASGWGEATGGWGAASDFGGIA